MVSVKVIRVFLSSPPNRWALLDKAEDWPGQHDTLRSWRKLSKEEKNAFCKRILESEQYQAGELKGFEYKEKLKQAPGKAYEKIKKVFKDDKKK